MDKVSTGILIIAGINLIATFCTPVILAGAYLIKRITNSDCCLGVISTRETLTNHRLQKRNLKKIIIISNNNIIKLNYI